MILEFIGLKFGHETDAAAFLIFVEEDAGTGVGDGCEGELELLAAVAAQGVEDVSGEALGVDADDGWSCVDVSHDESDGGFDTLVGGWEGIVAGLGVVDDALEAEDAEMTPAGGEVGVGNLADRGEGHEVIIRFVRHGDWIATEGVLMQ